MEIGIAVYHLVKQIQRMLMLVRKTGKDKFIYTKISVPITGSFTVKLRNDIMKTLSRPLGSKWNHMD